MYISEYPSSDPLYFIDSLSPCGLHKFKQILISNDGVIPASFDKCPGKCSMGLVTGDKHWSYLGYR